MIYTTSCKKRVGQFFSPAASLAGKIMMLAFLLGLSRNASYSQAGEWTWVKGDSTFNSAGIFGTQDVFSANNNPPALYEAIEWKDVAGHLWLFSGLRSFLEYNALWEYDPSINQWRWVDGSNSTTQPGVYGTQGVPSVNNIPGARGWGGASWTDNSGNFLLFGGMGYDANGNFGSLNDLWKYDVSTGEWTWISGSSTVEQAGVYGIQTVPDPANHPGARHEMNTCWIDDAGNIWLFGGYVNSLGGSFNDLWRFDFSTLEWTWMKGSSSLNQPGVYGTLGIANTNNTPGSRQSYSRWKDQSGNLWLFSGFQYNLSELRNDVWKYNPQTNEWAWMSGSSSANPQESLTSECDPSITNVPSGRFENRAVWSDCEGHVWVFGGQTNSIGTTSFSDLWSFNSNTLEWTLVNGSTTGNEPGFYGVQGISSPATYPKARSGSVSWTDDSCNLWMFGGSYGWLNPLSDLWKFKPDPSCPGTFVCSIACSPLSQVGFGVSNSKLCQKFCTDFIDSSSNNPTAWQWIFPGGSPSTSTEQNPTNICYDVPGVYDVTLITTSANGNDTLTLPNYITVYPTPPFPTITQVGYTLTSSPASSYQWQFNSADIPGATNQSYIVLQSGFYTVVVNDSNGCKNSLTQYVLISGINDVTGAGNISIYPNPAPGNFTVEFLDGTTISDVSIDVFNAVGQQVFSSRENSSLAGHKKIVDLGNAAAGVYFIEIRSRNMLTCPDFIGVNQKIIITK